MLWLTGGCCVTGGDAAVGEQRAARAPRFRGQVSWWPRVQVWFSPSWLIRCFLSSWLITCGFYPVGWLGVFYRVGWSGMCFYPVGWSGVFYPASWSDVFFFTQLVDQMFLISCFLPGWLIKCAFTWLVFFYPDQVFFTQLVDQVLFTHLVDLVFSTICWSGVFCPVGWSGMFLPSWLIRCFFAQLVD